jgi:hypothetical protein
MDPVREQGRLKALTCIPVIIALSTKLLLSSFSPSSMVYGLISQFITTYVVSPPSKHKNCQCIILVNIHSAA